MISIQGNEVDVASGTPAILIVILLFILPAEKPDFLRKGEREKSRVKGETGDKNVLNEAQWEGIFVRAAKKNQ